MNDPGKEMRMPQLTVTTDFSRDGLLKLRHQIDELLGAQLHGGEWKSFWPSGGKARAQTGVELAERKVREMRAKVSDPTWQFLWTCARSFGDDDEFLVEQVGEAAGLDGGTALAYYRNIARSERKADALTPGAPPLLAEQRTEKGRKWYRMPGPIREAILAVSEKSRS